MIITEKWRDLFLETSQDREWMQGCLDGPERPHLHEFDCHHMYIFEPGSEPEMNCVYLL